MVLPPKTVSSLLMQGGGRLPSSAPRATDPQATNAAEIMTGKALAAWNDGRIDEAVRGFRLAASLEPDNPLLLHNLSAGLERLGEADEALAPALDAVAPAPERIKWAMRARGLLQRMGG